MQSLVITKKCRDLSLAKKVTIFVGRTMRSLKQ